MSITTSACCAVTLNQQQEQNIQHHKQCVDSAPENSKCTSKTRTVTVVENGRAIVKPAPAQTQEDSSSSL
ncbi:MULTISPECIES: hypothetical protein [Nostocales]|uniref:Uncharacterized protein n=3 Tax=Nostocales TaxID=1161 RepID=A0A8S9SX94_9CYAN|nr:hypothetical protein [Tolypothrix bouteillei]KAF3884705.1 hypothetical protein DA73_0400003865 [Tolypothrix bouteillei VB521301]